MKKTKMCFLVHESPYGPDVFAYFVDEIADYEGNHTSYAHIGQHSACCIEYAKESRQAKHSEYLPLFNELRSIGYHIEVVSKGRAGLCEIYL